MASTPPPEWELHTPPTAANFRRLYDKHQLVLIRGALSPSRAGGWWTDPLAQLRGAFDAAPKMVASTWTCENGMKRDADEVLGRPAPRKRRRAEAEDERWYASFVVQPSGGTAQLDAFLATMPLAELPACFTSSRAARASSAPSARDAVAHANAVWVFFGRVAGREPLPGRPEHTDAVEQAGMWQKWAAWLTRHARGPAHRVAPLPRRVAQRLWRVTAVPRSPTLCVCHPRTRRHDGTWHLQCAGRKVWHLRPTDALVAKWRGGGGGDSGGGGGARRRRRGGGGDGGDSGDNDGLASGARVETEAGDVLVVNTRLWWHRTEIPDTRAAAGGLSLSNPNPNPNPSPNPDPNPSPNPAPDPYPNPNQAG